MMPLLIRLDLLLDLPQHRPLFPILLTLLLQLLLQTVQPYCSWIYCCWICRCCRAVELGESCFAPGGNSSACIWAGRGFLHIPDQDEYIGPRNSPPHKSTQEVRAHSAGRCKEVCGWNEVKVKGRKVYWKDEVIVAEIIIIKR